MTSRCRSRSPLQYNDFYGRSSPTPSNVSSTSNASQKSKNNTSAILGKTLKLSNLPGNWKWRQVSEYIKRVTKEDKAIGADIAFITLKPDFKHNELQSSVVLFKTPETGMKAYQKLKQTQEKVEGRKIFVHLPSETSYQKNSKVEYTNPNLPSHSNNMEHGVFGENYNKTYGLSTKYLTELGINPPLTRKVFVRYLPEEYNDEGKIRNVFGMAGTLLTVQVLKSTSYYNARLEYDHPVEAVQAVSMFNNQELMNRFIKCEMDSLPMRKLIDGLNGHGPGLGPNGSPMLGVRVAVELKQTKHEIMNEVHKLNETVDELRAQVMSLLQNQTKNTASVENTPNVMSNVANSMPNVANPLPNLANPIQNVTNPLAALGTLLTNQLQPMQLLQTLLQLNSGNDMGGVLGNAIQSMVGSNIDVNSLLQQAQAKNLSVQGNMQSAAGDPPYMQSGTNTQRGLNNMPSGSFNNMQSEPNMQDGPNNMQGGPNNNMPSGSFNNMQSLPQSNTQGPNMQRGPNNMPSGSFNNMQSGLQSNTQGPNMQRGPNNMPSGPFNVQSSPNNMQTGPLNALSGPNMQKRPDNMQSGPNNMQTGTNNMQIRPNNIPSGPNMSSVPFNMQSGPPIMQQGNHPFIPAQNINPGFNAQPNQPGFANMPPGHTNMQMPPTVPNQQSNHGFGGPQFNNGQAGQDSSGQSSTMLLFTNLPNSVTLPALQGKMREVGMLKLIEMTGPGRALVSFYSNFDAEKCIRLFNQSKVDGHTIEVRKV